MVELLSLFPSLLIVQFFRRIGPREEKSPLEKIFEKVRPSQRILKRKRRSGLIFPWWCLFIVYLFSFLIIGVSIFFILVRGIEFGDLKSQKWLTSVLTGIFSSIFCTQPIKIICLVIFFICFCRKSEDAKEENEYIDQRSFQIDSNEISVHSKNESIFVCRSSKQVNRLNEGEIVYARQQRLKTVQMWSIIKEFVSYSIFLILICLITFSNRDSRSFYQVNHLRKSFLNERQMNLDYTKVFFICFYKNRKYISFD